MPTRSCHPIPSRRHAADTNVSRVMLDRAMAAILKRARVDRNHDVPYLAGYSRDGKTIYIDRHLPRTFPSNGKSWDVDRYIVLHEEIEKTLIEHLDLHYQHAHQIAVRAEQAAVRADGIGWRDYDRFNQQYIKVAGDEALTKMPKDLDLKPYRDEHDADLLRRMAGQPKRRRAKPN